MFYHHWGLLPIYFNHLVYILRSSGDLEFPTCSNPLFQKLSRAVMVLLFCNLSIQEVEGEHWALRATLLHSEFEALLNCTRPCLKSQNKQVNK